MNEKNYRIEIRERDTSNMLLQGSSYGANAFDAVERLLENGLSLPWDFIGTAAVLNQQGVIFKIDIAQSRN